MVFLKTRHYYQVYFYYYLNPLNVCNIEQNTASIILWVFFYLLKQGLVDKFPIKKEKKRLSLFPAQHGLLMQLEEEFLTIEIKYKCGQETRFEFIKKKKRFNIFTKYRTKAKPNFVEDVTYNPDIERINNDWLEKLGALNFILFILILWRNFSFVYTQRVSSSRVPISRL